MVVAAARELWPTSLNKFLEDDCGAGREDGFASFTLTAISGKKNRQDKRLEACLGHTSHAYDPEEGAKGASL